MTGTIATLSYNEQAALDAIKAELKERGNAPDDWTPAEIMAFCDVESTFNATAYRNEPRIHDASYGLMQVLFGTANNLGFPTGLKPTALFDRSRAVHYGMKYLDLIESYLREHLGRDPFLVDVVAAYNMGQGAVLLHIKRHGEDGPQADASYVDKWFAAEKKWARILSETPDER